MSENVFVPCNSYTDCLNFCVVLKNDFLQIFRRENGERTAGLDTEVGSAESDC